MNQNIGREGSGAETNLAQIYATLGRYSQAADFVERTFMQPRYERYRDMVSALTQLLRSAPAKLEQPDTVGRLSDASFAFAHVGAAERVMEPFEEGGRGPGDIAELWHPAYMSVRQTERFKAFIRGEGLVDYWRARGWPDLCRSVGTDNFICD